MSIDTVTASAPSLQASRSATANLLAAQRLAVVIPCHNEAESLPKLAAALDSLADALAGRWHVEFLLIDDGSTDDTWRLLGERFGGRDNVRLVRHEKNRGIAAAIATGLAHAETDIVASIDADCTYDPRQLVPMLAHLSDDVDLVVASPYHPAGQVQGVSGWRLAVSKSAARFYRLLLRTKLHTYTSCFRVYRKSAVADLTLDYPGFVGIAELVWQLDRRGGRIVECPAVLAVRTTGHSKLRVVRTTLAHLRLLARVFWHKMCGTFLATENNSSQSSMVDRRSRLSAAPVTPSSPTT